MTDHTTAAASEKSPRTAAWQQRLVTFAVVAVFCILTAFWQSTQTEGLRRAQRAAYGNCLALQAVVEQTVRNVNASTALTPQQKIQALTTYTTLRSHLDCDGLKP